LCVGSLVLVGLSLMERHLFMGVSKCNGLVQFHSGTRLSFWVGFGMTEGGETVAGCSADDKRGRGVQWWDPLFLHANTPCALTELFYRGWDGCAKARQVRFVQGKYC